MRRQRQLILFAIFALLMALKVNASLNRGEIRGTLTDAQAR
jgi:hypothetical protein